MAILLPIAAFKDWICSLLNPRLLSNFYNDTSDMSALIGVDIPLRTNGVYQSPESDMRMRLLTGKDLTDEEEGRLLDETNEEDKPHLLKQSSEHSSWEIAKYCLYLAPIWFFTEVELSLFFSLVNVAFGVFMPIKFL